MNGTGGGREEKQTPFFQWARLASYTKGGFEHEAAVSLEHDMKRSTEVSMIAHYKPCLVYLKSVHTMSVA